MGERSITSATGRRGRPSRLKEPGEIAVGKQAGELPVVVDKHDGTGPPAPVVQRGKHLANRVTLRGAALLQGTHHIVNATMRRPSARDASWRNRRGQTRAVGFVTSANASPKANIAEVLVLGASPNGHASCKRRFERDRRRFAERARATAVMAMIGTRRR